MAHHALLDDLLGNLHPRFRFILGNVHCAAADERAAACASA
jgi:hypothetical protein